MYRQKRPTLTATAAVALISLAAACGSTKADGKADDKAGSSSAGAGSSLIGVYWSVDDLTVDGKTSRAPDHTYLRIADNGEVKGNFGCNSFGSRATVDSDRDRISFGQWESTAMACENAPMTFERNLYATLSDGTLTPRTTGEKLTLTTADGDHVDLTRQTDAPLYGTKWLVKSPDADGKAYLVFQKPTDSATGSATGKVSGSLGCNKVNAKATIRDGHITLGAASTTRMMCDTSLMKTEKALLRLFDSTVTYTLNHRTLTLTSENAEIVSATAAE